MKELPNEESKLKSVECRIQASQQEVHNVFDSNGVLLKWSRSDILFAFITVIEHSSNLLLFSPSQLLF